MYLYKLGWYRGKLSSLIIGIEGFFLFKYLLYYKGKMEVNENGKNGFKRN